MTRSSLRGSRLLKFLDRYVGIPVVLTFSYVSRMARRSKAQTGTGRIGVIKENAIGDTVILGLALTDLRRRHPNSKIILFAGESNFSFAQLLTIPDEVVLLPLAHPLRCIAILRSHGLDILFDGGQWPRINAILALLAGAGRTVGFRTPKQYRHFAYDVVVPHSADSHELDNFRRLLSFGSLPTHPVTLGIRRCPLPIALPSPYVVLHQWPGGEQSELKEWPETHWIDLARDLLNRGFNLILTGGQADYPRNEAIRDVLRSGEKVFNLAGQPLGILPTLLESAFLTISVNTGLMHLSAALGRPTIGLHGPTSSKRWGPIGAKAFSVVSRDPKSEYLSLGFEYPRACESMRQLHPLDVRNCVGRIIAESDAAGIHIA